MKMFKRFFLIWFAGMSFLIIGLSESLAEPTGLIEAAYALNTATGEARVSEDSDDSDVDTVSMPGVGETEASSEADAPAESDRERKEFRDSARESRGLLQGDSPRDKARDTLDNIQVAHLVTAPMSMGVFLYNSVFGGILLGNLYARGPDSLPGFYTPFTIVHMAAAAYAILSYTTTMVLSFTRMAIKRKHGIPFKRSHFIASLITTGFFAISVVQSAVTLSLAIRARLDGESMHRHRHFLAAHGAMNAAVPVAFLFNILTLRFGDYTTFE